MSANTPSILEPAIIAACTSVVIAVIGVASAYFNGNRQRRRQLYGEAYRAALAWKEMLYRVRRRAPGDASDHRLTDQFHDLQERIDYHQGWIGSESPSMARSYGCLVTAVKEQCQPLIADAWNGAIRSPGESDPQEIHPDVHEASNDFLRDVRAHLAWWQFPKLALRWRNRVWLRRVNK